MNATPKSPSAQKIELVMDRSGFCGEPQQWEACRKDEDHWIARFQNESVAKEWIKRFNSHEALLEACKFLIAQVETMAERSFSDGVQEWLSKNDAVNSGKRALSLAENPR